MFIDDGGHQRPTDLHLSTEGVFSKVYERGLRTEISATKQFYAPDSPWQGVYGHYRALSGKDHIYVSGTTATDPNSSPEAPRVVHSVDARAQTDVTLKEVIKAIETLGGRGAERIEFTDVLDRQLGGDIGSTAILLVVSNFSDSDMLVEIMVDVGVDAE